jgi:hypothetical protein
MSCLLPPPSLQPRPSYGTPSPASSSTLHIPPVPSHRYPPSLPSQLSLNCRSILASFLPPKTAMSRVLGLTVNVGPGDAPSDVESERGGLADSGRRVRLVGVVSIVAREEVEVEPSREGGSTGRREPDRGRDVDELGGGPDGGRHGRRRQRVGEKGKGRERGGLKRKRMDVKGQTGNDDLSIGFFSSPVQLII